MIKEILIGFGIISLILFSGCNNYHYTNNTTNNNFECNVYCNDFSNSWTCDWQSNNFHNIDRQFNKIKNCSCEFYNCLLEVKESNLLFTNN